MRFIRPTPLFLGCPRAVKRTKAKTGLSRESPRRANDLGSISRLNAEGTGLKWYRIAIFWHIIFNEYPTACCGDGKLT